MTQIHILNANKSLTSYRRLIKELALEALDEFKHYSTFKPIDIVIANNPHMVVPGTGIGGYCSTAHELYIPIDSSLKDIEKQLQNDLKPTIFHEMAHIVRLQADINFGPGASLADNAIGEGLADHLSKSAYPNRLQPWTKPPKKKDYEKTIRIFKKMADSQYYDHDLWFYGSKPNEIPHWAGYAIGFLLVEKYINRTNKKIEQLLLETTNSFKQEINNL